MSSPISRNFVYEGFAESEIEFCYTLHKVQYRYFLHDSSKLYKTLTPNFYPSIKLHGITFQDFINLFFLILHVYSYYSHYIHHHHVPEGLAVLSCSLILKMKLVPPPLPPSSRVPSSCRSIL